MACPCPTNRTFPWSSILALLITAAGLSEAHAETGYFRTTVQPIGPAEVGFLRAVALGDIDGDGDLDAFLIYTGSDVTHCQVWLNNGVPSPSGAAVFRDSGQRLVSWHAAGVVLADLDGDGDLDAFVASSGPPSTVWLNDGQGRFTDSGQAVGPDLSPSGIAAADLDGDGDVDLYFATAGGEHSQNDVVLINDGRARFSLRPVTGPATSSWAVGLADLDGDGDVDALTAVGSGAGGPAVVYRNDGAGNLSAAGTLSGAPHAHGVSLGDVDADGDVDALLVNADGDGNFIYLNDGAARFTRREPGLGFGVSSAAALRDLDGDGDLDAYLGNRQLNVAVPPDETWINDGAGSFELLSTWQWSSLAVALGDLDGDGDADGLLAQLYGNDAIVVLNQDRFVRGDVYADGRLNITDGISILYRLFVRATSTTFCYTAGDTNGDNAIDIADAIHVFNFLFLGGPAPVSPYPDCGAGARGTGIACDSYDGCRVR